MTKSRKILGLVIGSFLLIAVQAAQASSIYSEDPSNASGSGWSNTEITNVSGYGNVHGLWGFDNNTLSRNFSLSGNQTQVVVNFRYWAISSWDYSDQHGWDTAELLINNNSEWSSHVNAWYLVESPWSLSPTAFPNSDHGGYSNLTRYQDISITLDYAGSSLDVAFKGILSQQESDESWAVSNINISDNFSTVPAPIPEPATMILLGVGLLGISGVSRRKV